MEAVGKLLERSEKPTSNGNIRYSLKFEQAEGTRTYSGFKQNKQNFDFLAVEYGQWYNIHYYETDNPEGKYPFKTVIGMTPTQAPASNGAHPGDDIRRSKERTSLENCLIAASHLASVGDTEDLWEAALELYRDLNDWEEGIKIDKARKVSDPEPIDFDSEPQSRERPPAPHCQIHDKAMFRITGSDRTGHPYTNEDGERAMCYGEVVEV